MTTPAKQFGKAEAKSLTEKIRKAVDSAWSLLLEAHEGRAWSALGYETWAEYVKAEFGIGRSRSYQLLDQGRVIKAVKEASGDVSSKLDISDRQAAEIKKDLPNVTAEIRERVEHGEVPSQVVKEVIGSVADKTKPEPKQERRPSPPTVPELDGEDRIAELEEAVKALEAETTALKAENKRFGDMKAQFEAGGFEAVIAGKDEEIRVLLTRVERESADKVKWKRSADYWKAEAAKIGWKRDGLIPLEADNG